MEVERYRVKYNLTREEVIALKSLAEDKTMVIKQADKWGGIVILDHIDYEKEVMRQLSDHELYIRLPSDPITSVLNLVEVAIREVLSLDYINKDLNEFPLNGYP